MGWERQIEVAGVRRTGSALALLRASHPEPTVMVTALAALTAAVPLSFASGWRAGLVHLTAVLLAWAYNARLKATAASFVPYAVAFPLLVAFVTLGGPAASWPPWWALAAAALLGCSAHLV